MSRERGAGSVEYVGAVLVVGMLATALLVTGSCGGPPKAPPVPDFERLRVLIGPPEKASRPPVNRPPSSRPRPPRKKRPRPAPKRPRVEVPKWVIGR